MSGVGFKATAESITPNQRKQRAALGGSGVEESNQEHFLLPEEIKIGLK